MPAGAAEARNTGTGRRGIVAGGIIVLMCVAFGVFILPFAFTTPPPIITRFVATRAFSPGTPDGRGVARVAIRLSEPSDVTITLRNRDGTTIATLADGSRMSVRTFSADWDGTDSRHHIVPDGDYTVNLEAHAGEKKFSKSRRIVVDTTVPDPEVAVASGPAGCVTTATNPGEPTRVTVAAMDTGVEKGPLALSTTGTLTWAWNGHDSSGDPVRPGIVPIRITTADASGNTVVSTLTCWVSHLTARAVPSTPSSGSAVGVIVPGGADTEVTLSLRVRLGPLGGPATQPVVGSSVVYRVRGPAGRTRITIPASINPRGLWLLVSTDDGHEALIELGGPR